MKSPLTKRIDFLDGLRGIAVLIVFLAHTVSLTGLPVVWSGKIGVWLFFVLSAFLLTENLNKTKDKEFLKIKFWLSYFLRRFLRIYPLYLIVLIIDLVIFKGIGISSFRELFNHLFLTQGIMHYWTIVVEFKFYFILPVIIFVLRRIEFFSNKIFATFVLFISTMIVWLIFPTFEMKENSIRIADYLPIFSTGILASYIYRIFQSYSISIKIRYGLEVLNIIILVVIVFSFKDFLVVIFEDYNYKPEFARVYAHYYAVGWGILIVIFSILENSVIRKFFEIKILKFLGNISYPVYLIHYLVLINTDNPTSGGLKRFLIITVLTLIFSVIVHYVVEKKLMKVRLKY